VIIKECHSRGIRLIMDYSWNHTGMDFWALNDVRKNGKNSRFTDWYNILEYDNPASPENEFRYEGWGGGNIYMPVFRKDIIPEDDKEMPFEGNLHSESLRKHIFDVTKRWLDPDGDGNPSDGVDGFRLDVAAEVPMGFWREYRKIVRDINPEAYLVGEVWWLSWPDKLMDPVLFMGDQFDAIMNYRWFRIARGFFGQAEPVLNPVQFMEGIEMINRGIGTANLQAMMNVVASHDSPRLSTSLYNKTMDKYKAKPSDNPDYKINKPDALTLEEQKLLLVHQYTFIGAPHIWNGDEVGMWGADDPDCRKPMLWDDIRYEDEVAAYDPLKTRPRDPVKPDKELFSFYRGLIEMRKENPVLETGELKFLLADNDKMLLSYSRFNPQNEIIVIFNRSDIEQTAELKCRKLTDFTEILPSAGNVYNSGENGILKINLKPLKALVISLSP
jgi:glycosidase